MNLSYGDVIGTETEKRIETEEISYRWMGSYVHRRFFWGWEGGGGKGEESEGLMESLLVRW